MATNTTPRTIQQPTTQIPQTGLTVAPDAARPVVDHEMSAQELAEAVVVDGFEIHAAAVAALVAEANQFARSDVLAAVALDPHQPTVARERALGRLVAAYYRGLDQQLVADRAVGQPATAARFTVAA